MTNVDNRSVNQAAANGTGLLTEEEMAAITGGARPNPGGPPWNGDGPPPWHPVPPTVPASGAPVPPGRLTP